MASIKMASIGAYSAAFPWARTTLCRRSAGSSPCPMFVLVEPRRMETANPRPKTSNPRSAVQTRATLIAVLLLAGREAPPAEWMHPVGGEPSGGARRSVRHPTPFLDVPLEADGEV